MNWTLIPIALTFVALSVGTIRDWREHDGRKRRFALGLGLIGLVSAVASGAGAVKSNRDADNTAREMTALREQLQIANRKASLIASFPVKERSEVPRKVEVMPFQDTIAVSVSLFNPSPDLAKKARVVFQLPNGYTFSNSSVPLIDNGIANQREYFFDGLDSQEMLKPITFGVNVPVHNEQGFGIGVKSTCDNCERSDAYMEYLMVRWSSSRQTALAP